MEFEIFNDLDLEFFELKTQTPNDGEEIIIILKSKEDSGAYWNYNNNGATPLTNIATLEYATYYTYKTRPPKFSCTTKYRTRTFYECSIICWGRIKQD